MNTIPAVMENASAFEVYVWVHQCNRTFEQIRKRWNKTFDEIRAALDKGLSLGWQFIPRNELPPMPDPKPPKPPKPAPAPKISIRATKKAITAMRHKQMYEEYIGGITVNELAQRYGIKPKSVMAIIRNETHKVLEGEG